MAQEWRNSGGAGGDVDLDADLITNVRRDPSVAPALHAADIELGKHDDKCAVLAVFISVEPWVSSPGDVNSHV